MNNESELLKQLSENLAEREKLLESLRVVTLERIRAEDASQTIQEPLKADPLQGFFGRDGMAILPEGVDPDATALQAKLNNPSRYGHKDGVVNISEPIAIGEKPVGVVDFVDEAAERNDCVKFVSGIFSSTTDYDLLPTQLITRLCIAVWLERAKRG